MGGGGEGVGEGALAAGGDGERCVDGSTDASLWSEMRLCDAPVLATSPSDDAHAPLRSKSVISADDRRALQWQASRCHHQEGSNLCVSCCWLQRSPQEGESPTHTRWGWCGAAAAAASSLSLWLPSDSDGETTEWLAQASARETSVSSAVSRRLWRFGEVRRMDSAGHVCTRKTHVSDAGKGCRSVVAAACSSPSLADGDDDAVPLELDSPRSTDCSHWLARTLSRRFVESSRLSSLQGREGGWVGDCGWGEGQGGGGPHGNGNAPTLPFVGCL